jgi:hypothetical protein
MISSLFEFADNRVLGSGAQGDLEYRSRQSKVSLPGQGGFGCGATGRGFGPAHFLSIAMNG